MYIRKTTIHKDGKAHQYWALVESYRTERGPRQRLVAWLGEMDEAGRLGIERIAEGAGSFQQNLFENTEPEWVEVDVKRVRVEHVVDYGGPWLGLELMNCLGLDQFFFGGGEKKKTENTKKGTSPFSCQASFLEKENCLEQSSCLPFRE